ncbi:hypothetical protein QBC35DRAFT_230021 [Podospora australis]|uniref:Uncharacterized protein n=1 Tax=Podospora australis TaxID=1536484 RepID=A0AAN6WWC6_9PEZI|nr:hypothetical protein QBC35DRAFT_230021 [Podospora australis]
MEVSGKVSGSRLIVSVGAGFLGTNLQKLGKYQHKFQNIDRHFRHPQECIHQPVGVSSSFLLSIEGLKPRACCRNYPCHDARQERGTEEGLLEFVPQNPWLAIQNLLPCAAVNSAHSSQNNNQLPLSSTTCWNWHPTKPGHLFFPFPHKVVVHVNPIVNSSSTPVTSYLRSSIRISYLYGHPSSRLLPPRWSFQPSASGIQKLWGDHRMTRPDGPQWRLGLLGEGDRKMKP